MKFEAAYLAWAPVCVDLLIAVIVSFHAARALWSILLGQGSDAARLIIAQGVLAGLGFSMAGALLKTIALQNLASIRTFAFLFVFRTLLKQVFLQEEKSLAENRAGSRG